MLALALSLVSAFDVGDPPIVVDAAGGGDHTELQDAVDAATPHDVVIVLPGEYEAFELDKPLSIVGPSTGPLPHVEGVSRITSLGSVTLANLDLARVSATGVTGRLTLDACRIRPLVSPSAGGFADYGALAVTDCDDVELTACELLSDTFPWNSQFAALFASRSTVRASGCDFRGADGMGCFAEAGGHGVFAFASNVSLEGCRLRGGDGITTCGCELGCFAGNGGDGVRAHLSTVVVRGRPGDALHTGAGAPSGGAHGAPVRLFSGSLAWLSSPTFEGPGLEPFVDGSSALAVTAERPLLVRSGTGRPGGTYTLAVHAPVGAAGVVAIGAPAPPLALAPWDGPLLLGELLLAAPVVGEGLASPATVALGVPPTLDLAAAGFLLRAQAFFPGTPGLTNPAALDDTGAVSLVVGF